MNECWINIYDYPIKSSNWPTKFGAEIAAEDARYYHNIKTKYRIHVKLKDKPGVMSRPYHWTFEEWNFYQGEQWTVSLLPRRLKLNRIKSNV